MKVLIAEDDVVSRKRLEKFIADLGYGVETFDNGDAVWQRLQDDDAPRLLILDWMMPGVDGIEICRRTRALGQEPYTYIILLTAKTDLEDIVEGLEAGADDYITKPFNRQELRVRIRTGCRIVELTGDLVEARNLLNEKATHDEMTGSWNRPAIMELLEKEVDRSYRSGDPLTVAMMDIDHFKSVNDTYGHLSGDKVLRETVHRLESSLRPYDDLGRYGGEEFLIVLPGCDEEGAKNQGERFRKVVEQAPMPSAEPGTEIPVTISIGVCVFHPVKGKRPKVESLLAVADDALYKAKETGRNRVVSAVFADD